MNHNEKLDQIEKFLQIEKMIDSFVNIHHFTDLVAEICSSKADYIRENWGDEDHAMMWDDFALHMMAMPHHPDVPK